MKKSQLFWAFSVGVSLILSSFLSALSYAQSKSQGDLHRANKVVEDVPGRPELVKVTHIYRGHRGRGGKKPKPPTVTCSCPSSDGVDYSLTKVKWFDPTIDYSIYTVNSGLGSDTGQNVVSAVIASFDVWKDAHVSAPTPNVVKIDPTNPGPGIGLDNEQNVSWQDLSSTYGENTLAVTVYWYYRAKIKGFNKIAHFDVAYNTTYTWAVLAGEDCGGTGTAFDVQNIGAHEAGHVYGLAHNNDCNLTMNPTAGPSETIKSSLATGDINGIRAIY